MVNLINKIQGAYSFMGNKRIKELNKTQAMIDSQNLKMKLDKSSNSSNPQQTFYNINKNESRGNNED